ncbi:MAG TPA: dTDP-glucose 4,6-dehydratase [Candidatus Acidoferrum sp.]|nr:dTDP-glucose 4,6-dehydratase [Candidatus Acidoferrum sp.]
MNLLVTGGAGFVGANLIEHVIDHAEITRLVNLDCLTYAGNLDNLQAVTTHPKYSFERIDLRDRADVDRVVRQHAITHVMHLAAESHVDRSIAAPDDFVHTNVLGTFHLLEACRENWQGNFDGRRFLHVSTDEVYGSLGPTGAFTEQSSYAPSSPYSATKAAADMLVRAYHRTFGFPAMISNSANNFGPYQHREKLIPVIIASVIARRSIPLFGDGQQVRDWLYARDHAAALWLVLNRGRLGETYNIGAHNEWPNRKLAELICDFVDEIAPELGGNSRPLIAHVADRPGHDRRYAIDAHKIMRELGWKPEQDFDEALRETVRWYLLHRERLG